MSGNIKDFATSVVVTAPSPATSGTILVITTGHGTRMPATPFFAVLHPPTVMPTLDNAEKVQVTAVSTDTLTIVRAQGGTTAQSVVAGWRISNTLFSSNIPATSDDLTDGTTYKQYAATDKTKLAGIATGADVTATKLPVAIHAATSKATPVDSDETGIADSAASFGLKKLTWANLKATLKTYFNTLYQPLDATLTALAGLATGANKIPYSTGTDTFGQLDLSTSTSLGTSDTTIPTQNAVKAYVDNKSANSVFLFTDQSTSSTSYTDLATVLSTSVTVGQSGVLMVAWGVGSYNSSSAIKTSVALSGANTVAASDDWSTDTRNVAYLYGQTGFKIFSGLTPGSTTITMKYKTGSGTANFFNRSIQAVAL